MKTKDLEDRFTAIEIIQSDIKKDLSDLSDSINQTAGSVINLNENLTHFHREVQSISTRIAKLEDNIKRADLPSKSGLSPMAYLCLPQNRENTSQYEPVIKTDPPKERLRSNIAARTVLNQPKLLTPLERAKLALKSGAPRSQSPINPKLYSPVPNLTAPAKETNIGVPKIPTAQMVTNVKVSDPPEKAADGSPIEPVTVRAAKKCNLPIQRYIDSIDQTKKIQLKGVKSLIAYMQKVHKSKTNYLQTLDTINPWFEQWINSNPPASDLYNDLSLIQEVDDALCLLYAVQDVIENM